MKQTTHWRKRDRTGTSILLHREHDHSRCQKWN